MSVEVLGKALWLGEVGEHWVVGREEADSHYHHVAEPNPFPPLLSCSVWGVSLAWGTCSDMGASDWFAANDGKGQAALCSLLLFPQSHCCILFSSAIPCFIIAAGGKNSGVNSIWYMVVYFHFKVKVFSCFKIFVGPIWHSALFTLFIAWSCSIILQSLTAGVFR